MTDLTPPPELVRRLVEDTPTSTGAAREVELINLAFAAGADAELEACCEWLEDHDCDDPQETAELLSAARRPKQPSLKEQALAKIDAILNDRGRVLREDEREALESSRRALEQLPEGPAVTPDDARGPGSVTEQDSSEPTLKELALIQLSNMVDDLRRRGLRYPDDAIRAALEQLPEGPAVTPPAAAFTH